MLVETEQVFTVFAESAAFRPLAILLVCAVLVQPNRYMCVTRKAWCMAFLRCAHWKAKSLRMVR